MCSQGHYDPGDGVCSQSATSPPSVASPCSQATEAASVMTEPADVTACPSGLPRHRSHIQDNNKMADGGCPSSCPPAEQAEAGAPRTSAQRHEAEMAASIAGPNRRAFSGEPRETDVSQQQLERERPATSTETGRGTLEAAAKHSAVKSKAVNPLAVLQRIAESVESTPKHGAEDASQQSMLCGHTGLVSLAETPVPMGIKEDPHSPDVDPRKEGADKQISP